ncbi:FACT complex subunit SSRP1 [Tanacetum coccineum]
MQDALLKDKLKNPSIYNEKREVFVRWVAPPLDWVLLNTDGASRGNPGEAGGGALIRGIIMARDVGIRKLIIKVDSQVVVRLMEGEIICHTHAFYTVKKCRNLLKSLDWEVKLEHCYREANRAADWLANHGCEQKERLCMFDSTSPDLGSIILEDVKGVALSRRNVGQLKVHSRGRAWKKQGGGKVVEVDASEISRITWMKVPRSNQLDDVSSLTNFFQHSCGITPEEKQLSVSGKNWGELDINDLLAETEIQDVDDLNVHTDAEDFLLLQTLGAFVCWELNVESICLPLEEKVLNTIDECVEFYTFYAEIGEEGKEVVQERDNIVERSNENAAATEQATNAS